VGTHRLLVRTAEARAARALVADMQAIFTVRVANGG